MKLIISSAPLNSVFGLLITIAGGIGALVIPIIVYSILDFNLTKRAVEKNGRKWCEENNTEYIKTEMFKNHFALVYKDNSSKKRKKFRMHFAFSTWRVKKVDWLAK